MKRIKTNDTPATNSYIFISLFQFINIQTLAVLIANVLAIDNNMSRNTVIYTSLGLILPLFVTNHFLLYSKRESIFKKFDKLTQRRKTKGLIYFWLYLLLSIAFLAVVAANFVTTKY